MKFLSSFICILVIGSTWTARAENLPPASTQPSDSPVGERVPSEDSVLKDFHSLGLIDGRVDIFRCANPVRDLAVQAASSGDLSAETDEAKSRGHRLYDLGIRTIICLEDPNRDSDDPSNQTRTKQLHARIQLEKIAASDAGINLVFDSMNNAGANSMETLSDAQVKAWLDRTSDDVLKYSQTGGVVFHCSAGHDRTGMVAAYIRLKYQHWSIDQAIDEMRRYGHNWVKYSRDGGVSSWHEDHLRAIAKMLDAPATQPAK